MTGKEKDSNLAVFDVGVNRYPTMVSRKMYVDYTGKH